MTLVEVMVGFVIFSASLVAILNYVSNQIYLNHITEKNQQKASLIGEYSSLSAIGEQAQAEFISAQETVDIDVSYGPLDSFKQRNQEIALVETLITVTEQGNSYQWTILEIK